MDRTRMIFLFALCVTFCADVALSGTGAEPLRWHGNGLEVLTHISDKPMQIFTGTNPLNKARDFTCRSAKGCFVVASISETTSFPEGNENFSTCTYIDGQPAGFAPACDSDYPNYFGQVLKRQVSVVGTGDHTIQSVLVSNEDGGTAFSWEVDYSIYEKGRRP
ncbi:MAG: hypothetical protein JO261_11735 [Alphaproteobacteria bacterium]|nr:hypothetical protein [Alphaproteobacteria bacterium]MBV9694360.1 hypothetical protein [Alphaproteobacteria bacterium]